MKTLRGRPPRNISESGVIYLDSDGEDSDISDSEVEPVFFPAAGFDFNGEVLEIELQETDNEGDSSDDDSFVLEEGHDSVISVGTNTDDNNSVIIQFVGGTVQVRHIVNENYTQLQQELRDTVAAGGEGAAVPGTSTGGSASSSSDIGQGGSGGDSDLPNGESNATPQAPLSGSESTSVITVDKNPAMENAAINSACAPDADPDKDNLNSEKDAPAADGNEVVANRDPNCHGVSSAAQGIPEPSSSRIPPSVDSPVEHENNKETNQSQGDSDAQNRTNLKRKEPEGSEKEDNAEGDESDEDPQESGKPNRKALKNSELSDEEEETCNRMVSEDEDEETEDAFRGDRIGSTVYSERHVLKILMKWVEVLPSYSMEKLIAAREDETVSEEVIEKEILRLNNEFEEQMSLLWDMSAETDIMNFLLENKIFAIIRNTIENLACNRLIEVSLGILANVISEPSIIEDFAVHDSSLQIVEKVVELCAKITDVAVLIQAFSVLRRIVWYLRNVGTMKKWTDLLLSPGFLLCSNFIMSSSTNALLLGNVIMLCFTFLDSLKPDNDEESDSEDVDNDAKISPGDILPSSSTNKKKKERLTKAFQPFCEAAYVPALCEGLKELMKNPQPPKSRRKLTSTRENPPCPSTSGCQTDEHCPNADEIDIPIPEGHVQQAILKGFSALALLQKAPNGQAALKNHAKQVIGILLDFYRNFSICTEAVSRSDSLEYFALSLHLLSFCHCQLSAVNADAILFPVSTASKLMNEEERDKEVDMIKVQLKDGVEFDSVSYVALVVHEYLAAVAERFGPDCALKARNSTSHAKLFATLDKVVGRIAGETGVK